MKRLLVLALPAIVTMTAMATHAKISIRKARAIATTAAPGNIVGEELEREKGQWIYSFDIQTSEGIITDVHIDAKTGRVVLVRDERPDAQNTADRRDRD